MKKRSIVFSLLFSLSAAWACAGLLDKISVKPFPLLGQLPSNKVYCLHQDREGVLWLGTTDGLCLSFFSHVPGIVAPQRY